MITVHPGTIMVAEGKNVTLACEATGDGMLNYQWWKESLPMSSILSNSDKNLSIYNTEVDDSGQYYCEVDNGKEKVTSKKVQVIVRSQLLFKVIT